MTGLARQSKWLGALLACCTAMAGPAELAAQEPGQGRHPFRDASPCPSCQEGSSG